MATKGGSLSDMAVHGTEMPTENPTQEVVPSSEHPHANVVGSEGSSQHTAFIADNSTAMPSGPRDTGAGTGEVLTGTGDILPDSVLEKNLGPSHGGMEGKGGKTTSLAKQEAEVDQKAENEPETPAGLDTKWALAKEWDASNDIDGWYHNAMEGN